MGKLLATFLMPHPPILVPEVGRGEEEAVAATQAALDECARRIAALAPEVVIVITPHGPLFRDAMALFAGDELGGDLGAFRAPQVALTYKIEQKLTGAIARAATTRGVSCVRLDTSTLKRYGQRAVLDHGALVPLYFVAKRYQIPTLVHITYGLLAYEEIYAFGEAIREAVAASEKTAVIIASGDLSHRLTPEAPAGYHPRGREFDAQLVAHLRAGEVEAIIGMDPELVEAAGECGLRSLIVLLGALDGYTFSSEVLSYEGPFGVGYAVAAFTPGAPAPTQRLGERLQAKRRAAMARVREKEDVYVRLARRALETYVREGQILEPDPDLPPELLRRRAGAFVSLHKDGQLRGCIGTISPVGANLAEEIIQNAISAGTRDPRFDPVEEEELARLVYSVDVLGEPEPIATPAELNPQIYGVIVRSGGRTGLLLPALPGVTTVEEQVAIALRKAGIHPDEPYTLERFQVERHH